jgi:hypothetical protein
MSRELFLAAVMRGRRGHHTSTGTAVKMDPRIPAEEDKSDVLVRKIAVALPRELGVLVGSYLEASAQVVRRLERQPLPEWLGGW